MAKPYPLVAQHCEEDCGAACLATVAKYYGRTVLLTHSREVVGTGQLGTTLLGLRRGAQSLGFNTRSVKAKPEIVEHIKNLPLPAILHWEDCHWVVFYGKKGQQYIVADPANRVVRLSADEFKLAWRDGVMLLLDPDPVLFFQEPDEELPTLWPLLQRVWKRRNVLAEALLCAATIGILSLVSPFFLQLLTDDVLVRKDTQLLGGILLAVFVLFALEGALRYVENTLVAHFSRRIELEQILEFSRKLLGLPLTYFETRRSGEISSRLQDIQRINDLISYAAIALPTQGLVALISFSLMLYYSLPLAVLGLVTTSLMAGSALLLLPLLQRKTQKQLVLEATNQGILVEVFKGALVLKSIGGEPQFWEEFQLRFGRLANLSFATLHISIINKNFSRFVSDVGKTALLGFGGLLVLRSELTIGQLLAFTSLSRNVTYLMEDIIDFVDDFARVKTANLRVQEVITTSPETLPGDRRPWVSIAETADIVCEQLAFHYPGRVDLLDQFSLNIPGGKVTAIMGPSGCGKSTLAKIIAALYPVDAGTVTIEPFNLKDLALDCIRQQIVLVPQDAFFWSRSIVENFRLGAPHLSFEEIVMACQLSDADGFIRRLPEQYQTVLGDFGSNLSGGQRQRLAIARGLAHNPPVLILDEATAGLDPLSEQRVLEKILHHRQGKTTLLISHRPPVIQRADYWVLLEQGKPLVQGSRQQFEQLEKGAYPFLDLFSAKGEIKGEIHGS